MADIEVTMEVGGVWDTILPPAVSQVFTGAVNLTRLLTHYSPYSMTSNLAITAAASPAIGASAEVLLTADGSHTPTFPGTWKKWPASDDWLVTDGTVHKLTVYYDGTYTYYSLVIID
jgi:hypothetical protein